MKSFFSAFLLLALSTSALANPTPKALLQAAPQLKQTVALHASEALACAQAHGQSPKLLIVADMSLPSSVKRLWAFEVRSNPTLVLRDYVAHGRGSDPENTGRAEAFGNAPDSGMTSLGLYKIAEQYEGKHGLARRLDGLMRGLNDQARDRAVVLHSSDYVGPGHVGRSLGCPAVRQEALDELEKAGLTNAVLWIDGPDKTLEKALAKCDKAPARKEEPKAQVATAPSPTRWFGNMCWSCPFA